MTVDRKNITLMGYYSLNGDILCSILVHGNGYTSPIVSIVRPKMGGKPILITAHGAIACLAEVTNRPQEVIEEMLNREPQDEGTLAAVLRL